MMDDSLFNTTVHLRAENNASNASGALDKLYPDELILAYNTFLALVIAFGVFGNTMVLIVFIKIKVSSSTDCFIIFITVIDFISSVANVPVYLTFTNGMWQHYGNSGICKLHMYFSQVVVMSSAMLVCGLAIERFLLICRPHSSKISRIKARNICILFICIAAVLSIPSLLIHSNAYGRCSSGMLSIGPFLYFVFVFTLFIIIFFVVAVCYARICIAINRSEQRLNAHRRTASNRLPDKTSSSQSRFIKINNKNKIHPTSYSAGCSGSGIQLKYSDDLTDCSSKYSEHRYSKGIGSTKSTSEAGTMLQETSATPKINIFKGKNEKITKAPVWTTNIQCSDIVHSSLRIHPVGSQMSPETGNTDNDKIDKRYKMYRQFRQSVRTTKISFFVCTIFIVSWIIPLACFILLQITLSKEVLRFALFGRMTYLINTFANPFLYTWLNTKFRNKLKSCLCFWK